MFGGMVRGQDEGPSPARDAGRATPSGALCSGVTFALWRARRESDVWAATQPPLQYLTPPSNPHIYPAGPDPSIRVLRAL